MSTTIYSEDGGSFNWTTNYGGEIVDTHAHEGEDIILPLHLEKTLTENETFIECKDDNDVVKFSVKGDGDVDSARARVVHHYRRAAIGGGAQPDLGLALACGHVAAASAVPAAARATSARSGSA